MQPPGCKARWNTNFLFVKPTEPTLKKQPVTPLRIEINTLIVKL